MDFLNITCVSLNVHLKLQSFFIFTSSLSSSSPDTMSQSDGEHEAEDEAED